MNVVDAVQLAADILALAICGGILILLALAAHQWIAEEYLRPREDEKLREHLVPIVNAVKGSPAGSASDWRSWARSAREIHELPEARVETWR